MIKYRTRFGAIFGAIEAIDVLRETDKQVVLRTAPGLRDVREAKRSDWSNWHDTWEEAHAFVVDEAQKKVYSLLQQLEHANVRLGQIKGMKPPENVA